MDRKEEYRTKLLDPRWQQKRLRVFERDQWTCRLCGAKDKTLHLHHARYFPGEPWDTPDVLLFTACADCHEAEHECYRINLNFILVKMGELGLRSSIELSSITDAAEHFQSMSTDARGVHFADATVEEKADALAEAIRWAAKHRDTSVLEYWEA